MDAQLLVRVASQCAPPHDAQAQRPPPFAWNRPAQRLTAAGPNPTRHRRDISRGTPLLPARTMACSEKAIPGSTTDHDGRPYGRWDGKFIFLVLARTSLPP